MSLWQRSNPCERTDPFIGSGGSFQYILWELKTEYTAGHSFHRQFAVSKFSALRFSMEYCAVKYYLQIYRLTCENFCV